MAKPLTTRERNEVIGIALDANTDMYNTFLRGNGFNFEGTEEDKRIGAGILTMYHWGYLDDYSEKYLDDDVAPHMLMRWGRSVLHFNGKRQQYTLTIHPNNKSAGEVFK